MVFSEGQFSLAAQVEGPACVSARRPQGGWPPEEQSGGRVAVVGLGLWENLEKSPPCHLGSVFSKWPQDPRPGFSSPVPFRLWDATGRYKSLTLS